MTHDVAFYICLADFSCMTHREEDEGKKSALRWKEESGGEDFSERRSEDDILLINEFYKTFLRFFLI